MPFNLTITKALKVDQSVDADPSSKGLQIVGARAGYLQISY